MPAMIRGRFESRAGGDSDPAPRKSRQWIGGFAPVVRPGPWPRRPFVGGAESFPLLEHDHDAFSQGAIARPCLPWPSDIAMATTQRPQYQPGWAGGCPSDGGPGHAARNARRPACQNRAASGPHQSVTCGSGRWYRRAALKPGSSMSFSLPRSVRREASQNGPSGDIKAPSGKRAAQDNGAKTRKIWKIIRIDSPSPR